jgi:putative ABC transport system permease protein
MLFRLIDMALSALRRNRMRTALAILGVGIGIAAVIATAALGGGSALRVQAQLDSLGDTFIWIRAGNRNIGGVRTGSGGARTLTVDDSEALAAEIPEITKCSPNISGREQIIFGNQNWNTRYQGVSPDFFEIRQRTASRGTLFNVYDETHNARVVVLGSTVAEQLFGGDDPVGRSVRIGRFVYQILGVLESKGVGGGGLDRDDTMFVPFTTAMRLLERHPWISDVMCSASSATMVPVAEQKAVDLLRERHEIYGEEPNDFELQDPTAMIEMRARTTETLRLLLTAIGSVSLVVGGIGIMNIMLVSVTERRREIGARMAVGARVRDIRWQFLLEAATIGTCGGLAGIGLGIVASWLLGQYYDAPVVVSGRLIAAVTAAAIGAGLLFGYLPAHRASALDPIEALRAEN